MPGYRPHPERRFARDAFAGCWRAPGEILFSTPLPTCTTCGATATGTAKPERLRGGRWRYRVCCDCGDDTIDSDFPLCMGGTLEWWRRQWGWSSMEGAEDEPEEDEEMARKGKASPAAAAPGDDDRDAEPDPPPRAPIARTGQLRLSELLPVEYNARTITEHQAQSLQATIEDFGFLQPLVINTHPGREMRIIGGEQRWRQLRELYGDDAAVPDLVSEDPETGEPVRRPGYVLVNLDPEAERELNIRLNRVGGDWDWSRLDGDFKRDDLLTWGFEPRDFRATKKAKAADGEEEPGEGDTGTGPAVKMVYLFCTPEQHEQLTEDAQVLQELYGASNFTETVCAVARAAAEAP